MTTTTKTLLPSTFIPIALRNKKCFSAHLIKKLLFKPHFFQGFALDREDEKKVKISAKGTPSGPHSLLFGLGTIEIKYIEGERVI